VEENERGPEDGHISLKPVVVNYIKDMKKLVV
jgi:hypothetical protein